MSVFEVETDAPEQTSFSLLKYDKPTRVSANISKNFTIDEHTLNDLFPPKVWEEDDGVEWECRVNLDPVSRDNAIYTSTQLNQKLSQLSARDHGICQVRRELYSQCFEELIRQTCLTCMERGLLLLRNKHFTFQICKFCKRIRDEFRMTLHAAKTLYETSLDFGIRQAVKAEQCGLEKKEIMQKLEKEVEELRMVRDELKASNEMQVHETKEQHELLKARHQEEMKFLKRTTQQLKTQLDSIVGRMDN